MVLADASGDKVVKSKDARLILRCAAKLIKGGETGADANIIGSSVRLVKGAESEWGYTVVADYTDVAPVENTTAAPAPVEDTTAAPEITTAAPEITTAAPEITTAVPELTTAAAVG